MIENTEGEAQIHTRQDLEIGIGAIVEIQYFKTGCTMAQSSFVDVAPPQIDSKNVQTKLTQCLGEYPHSTTIFDCAFRCACCDDHGIVRAKPVIADFGDTAVIFHSRRGCSILSRAYSAIPAWIEGII